MENKMEEMFSNLKNKINNENKKLEEKEEIVMDQLIDILNESLRPSTTFRFCLSILGQHVYKKSIESEKSFEEIFEIFIENSNEVFKFIWKKIEEDNNNESK